MALKDKIDRVIAGDTDSAYVDLTDLIMKLYLKLVIMMMFG